MASTNIVDVEDWLDEDQLLLLECWSRDGYTYQDIANRIGTTTWTLAQWRKKYPEIDKALKQGREIVDYKVENALLKAALGYKTKEVTVTTTLRNGKMVEEMKQTVTREQAPNVSAIQTWLYNRCRDKWKNMNSRSNFLEEISDDTNVSIVVTRAGKNAKDESTKIEQETTEKKTSNEPIDSGVDLESNEDTLNESVTIRGLSKEEKRNRNKKKNSNTKSKGTSSETKSSSKTDKPLTKIELDEWDRIEQEEQDENWED